MRKEPEQEIYYGTRFDNVKVELTQASHMAITGNENADVCVVKIPMGVAGTYMPPKQWEYLPEEDKLQHFTFDKENKNFFAVVRKKLLGIDVKLPLGMIDSGTHERGFFQYVSRQYNYVYMLNRVDVYELIPRFEICGGK